LKRSKPLKAELRRISPSPSCCPDLFSRSEACRANAESFLEIGVLVKEDETGEGATGEGGDCEDELLLLLPVELVDGLSLPRALLVRDCKKAL